MILVDANLLVYAANRAAPEPERARTWLDRHVSGTARIGFPWPSLLASGNRAMTFLVECLVDLRRHLDHLRDLQPRVPGPDALRRDLSLHNDVLFPLLMVAQLVIDIAGELSARRRDRFDAIFPRIRGSRRIWCPNSSDFRAFETC